MRTVPLVFVLPLFAACAHSTPHPVAVTPHEYRLGSDDLVDVEVWKEPALSAIVPVRPDGKISLPMAGELQAAGRTPDELQRDVAQRLRAFVPEPVVAVMVKEVRAARFFVLGEVTHPGAFPLNGTVSVLQAISIAGGPTEFARRSRVVVIRSNKDGLERLRVNMNEVISGGAEPLSLVPGDTIYVP